MEEEEEERGGERRDLGMLLFNLEQIANILRGFDICELHLNEEVRRATRRRGGKKGKKHAIYIRLRGAEGLEELGWHVFLPTDPQGHLNIENRLHIVLHRTHQMEKKVEEKESKRE